jgi:hypothetical protein
MAVTVYDPARNAWVTAIPAMMGQGSTNTLLLNLLLESKVQSLVLDKIIRGEGLGPDSLDSLRSYVTSDFGQPM